MSGSKNKSGRPLFFILGNQLFPPSHLDEYRHARFFMAEDHGLCTYVRHHKQKIVLFLAAMRAHADELRKRDFSLDYIHLTDLDADVTYEQKLARAMDEHGCDKLIAFEMEDRFFEKRIRRFADDRGVELTLLPSPMFLTPRDEFADYLDETNKPFMATFYQRQRKRMNLLLDADGGPIGGRWSFDDENRRKLPGDVKIPDRPQMNASDHVCDVCRLVEARFPVAYDAAPGSSLVARVSRRALREAWRLPGRAERPRSAAVSQCPQPDAQHGARHARRSARPRTEGGGG